ncbi:hypothetical protein MJO29_013575 [Puccinia striiformis f. sp. tritici]|nr:hypothetical protein MJO29_013575 [Puccinia striiformis f. sp. tritici]
MVYSITTMDQEGNYNPRADLDRLPVVLNGAPKSHKMSSEVKRPIETLTSGISRLDEEEWKLKLIDVDSSSSILPNWNKKKG